MRWPLMLAVVLVVAVPAPGHADISGTASVIDGDTLEIAGERIRLHGNDAPESGQECIAGGERWRCGMEAASALAFKIARGWVTCQGEDRDRYSRLIAVCYAGGVGGPELNAWLVSEGWALAYRRFSTDYVAQEQAARGARRGLWRGAFVAPWDWRRGVRLSSAAPNEAEQLSPAPAQPELAVCCKICRKGKACGNSCISRSYTCHKPPGCACNAY